MNLSKSKAPNGVEGTSGEKDFEGDMSGIYLDVRGSELDISKKGLEVRMQKITIPVWEEIAMMIWKKMRLSKIIIVKNIPK